MNQNTETIDFGEEYQEAIEILKTIGRGRFSVFIREAFMEKWEKDGQFLTKEYRDMLRVKLRAARESSLTT